MEMERWGGNGDEDGDGDGDGVVDGDGDGDHDGDFIVLEKVKAMVKEMVTARVNPASFILVRNSLVLLASFWTSFESLISMSKVEMAAPTTAGATEFENRYGRERWRSTSTISARDAV